MEIKGSESDALRTSLSVRTIRRWEAGREWSVLVSAIGVRADLHQLACLRVDC